MYALFLLFSLFPLNKALKYSPLTFIFCESESPNQVATISKVPLNGTHGQVTGQIEEITFTLTCSAALSLKVKRSKSELCPLSKSLDQTLCMTVSQKRVDTAHEEDICHMA